jgi:DNA end-binding protein Ku
LPRSKKSPANKRRTATPAGPAARPIWSGTITFGLVSIPVDLLAAVRAKPTAMNLVDREGHPLGRQYYCSRDGKRLENQDLVRGYETEDGTMVVVTDKELESAAPEMSSDIRLKSFSPLDQIPPIYFQKSYYLAPSGKSATAYNLLAATMQRCERAGIGSFVMRGHEYLVAIVADHGVLRADTLRYADEIRSPASLGLPAREKPDPKLVNEFIKELADLKRDELSLMELEDQESAELQALVKESKRHKRNVIEHPSAEPEADPEGRQSAQIIDLTEALRRSLSKRAVVSNAEAGEPISLAARRSRKR